MPQQNDCLLYSSTAFVSDIDYSEAQTILDLTTTKQKQLRRQRSQVLFKQVLLKRTYTLVCDLLDSDCSISSPLTLIATNKRKISSDDNDYTDDIQPMIKKSKSLMDKCYDIKNDNHVLKFLRELNSVKLTRSSIHMNFSENNDEQYMAILISIV